MRRPTFERWIKREVMRISKAKSFNFRKLAALAQRDNAPDRLAAALLLYARETGRTQKLLELVWNEPVRREYEEVLAKLGGRSAEELALRGTPMMSLDPAYWSFLARYADDYYAPERLASQKRELWEEARQAQLKAGVSPTEAAKACELDVANVTMFLNHADLGRLTIGDAKRLTTYLTRLSKKRKA